MYNCLFNHSDVYFMKPILIMLTAVAVISYSCKKHYYNERRIIREPSPIAGTWDFLSMDAQTQSSKEFRLAGFNQKSDAVLNYVTENNAGELIITDSIITTIRLTYTISSNIKTYNYKNGLL